MNAKVKKEKQALRQSTLHSQLSALASQAAALRTLDSEHSLGIQHSREVTQLDNQTGELVARALSIVEEATPQSHAQTIEKVAAFRQEALVHKASAKLFLDRASANAQARLSHALENAGLEDFELGVPHDARRLTQRAETRCCMAETEQFQTFILQIESICDLCCEMLFFAAAETAPKE